MMSRRLPAAVIGLFALTIWVGTAFVSVSSAAPSHAPKTARNRTPGLTQQGIENARQAGLPSRLVTMAPQSSLKLLSHATKVGPHAVHSKIELIVGLKLRHVAKLKSFLRQVQNPTSSLYHQWLTPEEFTKRYGPSKADVAQVVQFLKARGIKVENVAPNRMLIHTEATTAVYEHAFGVMINDYQLNGRSFYSTSDSPKLPRAIAPLVTNILGLNHGVQMHPRSHLHALAVNGEVAPQATPPASTAYFNPKQIAEAYDWPDITDADNGAGVSIAILTAETPNASSNPNYHNFWTAFGLPDHTINVIPIGGASDPGGAPETTLDIEWSGAMAPGATLNVYVAANVASDTFTAMYNRFVTDNNSQVMTTSWGLGETGAPDINLANEQIFMQAAAQGISMFAAAGDNGASDCAPPPGYCPPGPNNADFPSSSEYITAANGTELSISDKSGTYGSEQASIHTGGAISALFAKPEWQTGPGVPADINKRMNSDLALNYGSVHPYLILANGPQGLGYYGVAGTSAVAPILSGLFAIGVSQQPGGASLGQSNSLIYNDVNAGNYASDFHDVTSGCNGKLPDGTTPSCATTNWDHPTGWGSPKATSLLSHLGVHGPAGTLEGTVTDAASGAPVADAIVKIVAGNGAKYETVTGDEGQYSKLLPAGKANVTVSGFGYEDGVASPSISDGQTTTQDFALSEAPKAMLSGKVSDGSGHGYGLYAEIKVRVDGVGQVADIWTDPSNGDYSVELPKGLDYTLDVAAALGGYNTGSAKLSLDGNKTKNFALPVIDACTAPGYAFGGGNGFGEDFNGATFPSEGWTVANAISGSPVVWKLNTDSSQDNWTGGTGTAAEADGDASLPDGSTYRGNHDTSLVTPPIAVSSLNGTRLRYKANYYSFGSFFHDSLDLDISTDGGDSWTTILHWDKSTGSYEELPGKKVSVDLAPYLPSSGSFRLRWRYYDLNGGVDFYAQIDDVVIGSCAPVPGGLVTGQVTDANTGKGIVGAHVEGDQGKVAATQINPADANLPVGTYLFFASKGDHHLTAGHSRYADSTADVGVSANAIVQKNFALKAGQLKVNPSGLSLHVMVNNPATASLALKNIGSGEATFRTIAINSPVPGSAAVTGPFAIAAHYSKNTNLAKLSATGKAVRRSNVAVRVRHPAVAHAAGSVVAALPIGFPIYGLGMDHDTNDLWVGSPFQDDLDGDGKDHRFLLDGTNTGDAIDVINDKVLYMADMAFDDNTGMFWQLSIDAPSGNTSHIYEIDPKTMQETGNSIAVPSSQSERGLAFDPLTNTWYAGGFGFGDMTIYHFDASGTLLDSVRVGLPITGLAYNPATGHLFVLTSNGQHAIYVLDARNNYALLSHFDIYGFSTFDAGAGLGYDCAGNLVVSDFTNNIVRIVASGEPGWCTYKGIPWLTLAPESGTLSAGDSAAIALDLDGAKQKPFTTSEAHLAVTNNTPYDTRVVPITVHWEPQPVSLSLAGESSPPTVHKGDNFAYSLTVKNVEAKNHGTATETTLTYELPSGVNYVASSGDARCAAPTAGSSPAPEAVTGGQPVVVTCDLGSLAQGASKTVTIAVRANQAGTLDSHFEVSSREPNDSDKSTLDIHTTVIGTADVSASAAGGATITEGSAGPIKLAIANAGPDPATDVQLKVSTGGNAKLTGATSSQGSCTASGKGVYTCDIGEVMAKGKVGVTLTVLGTSAGTATVQGQALTSSDDPDQSNDVATATVTVKAASNGGGGNDGGGGGALGWLALAALLGLALAGVGVAKVRKG